MDTAKPVSSSNVSGLVRSFAKVLKFRAAGVAPDDTIRQKTKFKDILEDDNYQSIEDEERIRNKEAVEALLAKVFASLSSVKAAYAELQFAQSPYNAEVIQSADEIVVAELKLISELKQCYLKQQIDLSPQVEYLLVEAKEQKSLLKMYEIMMKKFDSQLKLKDSEVGTLQEQFEELNKQNGLLEGKLKSSRSLNSFQDLHLSGLNPNNFNTVLRHTVKSIRSFVKLMMDEMESTGWDLDAAASAIEPKAEVKHRHYVFESYVCQKMFDGFKNRRFCLPADPSVEHKRSQERHFFDKFMELKSIKPKEFHTRNPLSSFAKFLRVKYLELVHPKMELSLFGDLSQRKMVNSGGYPDSNFFSTFAEMARRVWLLHCLAFSFKPEASIFQIKKGCRFSEVYMEGLTEDAIATLTTSTVVGFTVVPGFKIGKVVIQAKVYLTPPR